MSIHVCTYDRTEEITQMFALFDKDKSGSIDNKEVGSLIKALGRDFSDEEIEKLIEECDKDKNGTIDRKELIAYFDKNYTMSENNIDEIIDAFRIFDYNNDGFISASEFKKILTGFNGEFTDDQITHIFAECDLDHDGKISYAEFLELWKCS